MRRTSSAVSGITSLAYTGMPVEAAAAEQLGDGRPGGLAGDVPEGDVDRADHVQRRAAAPVVVARVEQPLPQAVDLQRVLADQHLAQAAGDRWDDGISIDRPREERRRVGLTHADDPLVGVDPNEEGVLGPVGAASRRPARVAARSARPR